MTKIGRNDPCVCGSGKKYKKCCMNNKTPRMGVVRRMYEAGTADPFGRMLMQNLGIRDHAIPDEEKRLQFDQLYGIVSQNLYEALLV